MLEWLEARRLVWQKTHEYRIEPLKCDRDALKQECRLACVACSGTQPPSHLREKIQIIIIYLFIYLFFILDPRV